MSKQPNPQGKGLVPVLQSLQSRHGQQVLLPKQIDQIEMELFTSLFVLQSELKFNPVAGRNYYMYEYDAGYRLLMVAPHEWHRPYCGRYIGECTLQRDRTWTLLLAPALVADAAFMARIDTQRDAFLRHLEAVEKLEDIVPEFEQNLGYHGRVLAFILGKSLLTSMQLSGIHSLDYQAAKGLLAAPVSAVE